MWRRFAVAVAASALTLAAATAQAEPKQGGEMVVTYKDDISTFDPAIGYDWQNWSMIKSLFDGLMDYKPGTTELIPDLAESYTVSDDGLVYTFKLREGVKFHNGRELLAVKRLATLTPDRRPILTPREVVSVVHRRGPRRERARAPSALASGRRGRCLCTHRGNR